MEAFLAYAKASGDSRTWDSLSREERFAWECAAMAAIDSASRSKMAPVSVKLARTLASLTPDRLSSVIRVAMVPDDALPGVAESAKAVVAWCDGNAARTNLVRAAFGYVHLDEWMSGVKAHDLPSVMHDAGFRGGSPESHGPKELVALLRRWCGRSGGRYGSVYRAVQKYHDGRR